MINNHELTIRLSFYNSNSIMVEQINSFDFTEFSNALADKTKLLFEQKADKLVLKYTLYSDNDLFFDYLNTIQILIATNKTIISELNNHSEMELSLELFINLLSEHSLPPFHLDNELIRLLSELKIEVDFDILMIE